MKVKNIYLGILISILFILSFAWAVVPTNVANTKHNLSVSGTGAITATSEAEVCVFCHIPHNASPAVPLWNQTVSTAAYNMYNSEYLNRAGYTVPSSLGAYPNTGYRSRLCLSCHDGTVAIGQVYILRGNRLTSPISMSGVTADNKMPASASNLGTNLTDDHPVAIIYDTSKNITFPGSGNTRNMELNSTLPPINPKPYENVKLFSPSPGYVECESCHDPHITYQKFLVIWNTNLATTISDLCDKCHTKTNWSGSIHKTSGSTYSDSAVQSAYGANTVSGLGCTNCHRPHSGQGSPYWYLLRQVEESTCFLGASSLSTGAPCHGTGASSGGKDIQTAISRTYRHPTTDNTYQGKHTDLDVLSSSYLDWSSKRHAECVDCHNPHQAQSGTHNETPDATNTWYPASPTNNVSNVLKGVTGTEPTTEPDWSSPTTFNTLNVAAKEYQICFKCHSYYGLQGGSYTTSYGDSATITDQAKEYSTGNKSVHPVRVGLNSQTGSYSPTALTAAQMKSPWDTNLGNNTMYCSDCHGTDDEPGGDPKGPHGSTKKYMLKGSGKYWPYNSSGTLWTTCDYVYLTNNFSNDLFCKNCHLLDHLTDINYAHYNGFHLGGNCTVPFVIDGTIYYGIPCVTCHLVVPHGGKRSRLIAYGFESTDPDVTPYIINTNTALLRGFKKDVNGTYSHKQAFCYSTAAACTQGNSTHQNGPFVPYTYDP
ncbi:MAG: cytochrome C [Nitrospirae bacterium]|nr:cytochrome C [Nitrospirota bacterium]